MKTILCNDCGEVMTRFKNICTACSRTDLTFYPYPDDPELIARVKELRGNRVDMLTRVMYGALLVGIFSVITYSATEAVRIAQIANAPVQTASTSTTVPQ